MAGNPLQIIAGLGKEPEAALAGATPYLRLFGLASGGCLLAKQALSMKRLGTDAVAALATARFFAEHAVVASGGLERTVVEGAASVNDVGVVGIEFPIEHAIGPVGAATFAKHLFDFAFAEIVREQIVILISVQNPREIQLPDVIETSSGSAFFTRAGQCRKEKRSQNCNNGNDNEQFNQRKTRLSASVN